MNVLQNFSMRKIHPKWEKTSKATWSCAKSGMFCFRKKSSSFFLKISLIFFSWKNTTCLSILILTLWNTTLNNTREFFIMKNICKKKKTGKIFGGRNSLFLTRVFCFQNSVFSVSHYFPHLAVPVFEQKRAKTKVWLFLFFAFRFVNSVVEIWNVIVSVSSSFLIKNHLVFQTNGIKLWKSQKPSQQKFKGSKNIFCDAIFSSIWLQSVAKIVENKMAVFLWKRKKLKGKKLRNCHPPKNKKMVAHSQSSLEQKEYMKKIVCFSNKKRFCVILWFYYQFYSPHQEN